MRPNLLGSIDKGKITGHITTSTVADIYYISQKENGHKSTLEFTSNLIGIVEVTAIDRDVIVKAVKSEMKDFEDAVQVSAARFNGIDCLITRSEKDLLIPN